MHLPLLSILILAILLTAGEGLSETVVLSTGEKLSAESVIIEGRTVVIRHKVLGTLKVSIDDIQSIDGRAISASTREDPAGKDSTPPAGDHDSDKANSSEKSGFSESPSSETASGWKGSFTLAGSLNEGTTQNASLFTQLTYGRENVHETTSLTTFYRFASSSGDTTQSWFNITGNQLWKIQDSPWGIFADAEFDWSEFNTWEQRIAAHGGMQYRLLNLSRSTNPGLWFKSMTLDGKIGVGPRKEFSGESTNLVTEGELGGILNLDIFDDQTLEADASYFPVLTGYDDYRFEANLNWKIPLHLKGLDGLAIALGIKYQYQLMVSDEDKHYDLLGILGVTYDF